MCQDLPDSLDMWHMAGKKKNKISNEVCILEEKRIQKKKKT